MPQSTLLSIGTTDATSATTAIPSGQVVTIGLFVSTGNIPTNIAGLVYVKTPSADTLVGNLTMTNPVLQVQGPCDIVVRRLATTVPAGVFLSN